MQTASVTDHHQRLLQRKMRDEKLKLMFMYKLARRLEKEHMWKEKFGESYDVYKRRKLEAQRAKMKQRRHTGKTRSN